MATPVGTNTYNTIAREFCLPDLVDQVYGSSPLFFRLNSANRILVRGGKHIEQGNVTKKRNVGGAFSGYDVLDSAPADTLEAMAWDWKQYETSVTISGLDKMRYESPEAKVDYLKFQFDQAKDELYEMLAFDLWANCPGVAVPGTGYTNNPKGLDGIRHAINDGTVGAVYGGVDRTLTPNAWAKAQYDAATTTLTIPNLNRFFMACKRGAQTPTSIWSNSFNYQLYYSKAFGLNPTVSVNTGDNIQDQTLVDAGFTNLLFNKRPWIIDDFANGSGDEVSAGPTYFLNENALKLFVHSGNNFRFRDFEQPTNQDAAVARIFWAGNLAVTNPRTCGVMTALAS